MKDSIPQEPSLRNGFSEFFFLVLINGFASLSNIVSLFCIVVSPQVIKQVSKSCIMEVWGSAGTIIFVH